jgi:hypothetical protein
MTTMQAHYEEVERCFHILGLEEGASLDEIKHAYRHLAKIWHPDRFENDPTMQSQAEERLKELNWAYDILRVQPPPRPAPAFETASRVYAAAQHEYVAKPPISPPHRNQESTSRATNPIGQSAVADHPAYNWFIRVSKILAVLLTLNLIRLLLGTCAQ